MAKIKQGILGGFSGSVANVVGSSWKGIATMKSKPLSVANPKTEGQVAQRTSFKGISQLGSAILTDVCQPVYNPTAQKQSGFNQFCSQNKLAFDSAGDFDATKAYIGAGTLTNVSDIEITTSDGGATLDMVYVSNVPALSPRLTDNIYGFAICPSTGDVWAIQTPTARSTEAATMVLLTAGSDLSGELQIVGFPTPVSGDGRSTGIKRLGETVLVNFG